MKELTKKIFETLKSSLWKKISEYYAPVEIFIIGFAVICALVLAIQTVIVNYGSKLYKNNFREFSTEINYALRDMQIENKLVGYKNTSEFVQELSKYLKITKICENNHLSECFAPEISKGNKTFNIEELKYSKRLGQLYDDKNIGIIIDNKYTAIITYDPKCSVPVTDFYGINPLKCIGMVFDLNGFKKPNSTSKDIGFLNTRLQFCDGVEVGNVCWLIKNTKKGYANCGAGGRKPTTEELQEIFSFNVHKMPGIIESELKHKGMDIDIEKACFISGEDTASGITAVKTDGNIVYGDKNEKCDYYTMCVKY